MQYSPNGNGASHRRLCLSGASLAQLVRKMCPVERALLAANILDGDVVITALTRKTVTSLCGATPNYLDAALRCTPEQRAAVARGERSLFQPRTKIDDAKTESFRRICAVVMGR